MSSDCPCNMLPYVAQIRVQVSDTTRYGYMNTQNLKKNRG